MGEFIQYDFLYDNHFAELKEAELMNERLTLAQAAEPYVGKYYSQDYLRRKVLRQTDQEILEQDELIEKEIKAGVILILQPLTQKRVNLFNPKRMMIRKTSNGT